MSSTKKEKSSSPMPSTTPTALQLIARQRREIVSLKEEVSACHRQIKKLTRWQDRILASIAEINMPPGSQDPIAYNRLKKNMKR
jgi:hypothetical protein